MERVSSVAIPKAGANEYLTVLVPATYDFTKATQPYSTNQRVIPVDQPGLRTDEPEPDPEPENSGINEKCVENSVIVTGPNGETDTDKTECDEKPELEPKKIRVGVTKVDAVDKSLSLDGAEFTLYPSDVFDRPDYTKPIQLSAVDGSKELFATLGEEGGVYHLVETKAPDGYSLLLHPVTFLVEYDESGKLIAKLQDTGGTLIDISVDSEDPKCVENSVTVTGPNGETVTDQTECAALVHLKVADVKAGQLPHTGGLGVLPLAIAGFAVIFAGGRLLRKVPA